MHSVRIELAKLILVCTRITYQATGDAGWYMQQTNIGRGEYIDWCTRQQQKWQVAVSTYLYTWCMIRKKMRCHMSLQTEISAGTPIAGRHMNTVVPK